MRQRIYVQNSGTDIRFLNVLVNVLLVGWNVIIDLKLNIFEFNAVE